MTEPIQHTIQELDSVVIRFAGDSGDGMQLTGTQFTNTSAVFGNDISTMPDFPAEIRAPVGTLAGVSGFQVHFANSDVLTPGDQAQVLIAMNPAALKAALADLERGGTIIANSDAFKRANLKLAGYEANPLEDGSLQGFNVIRVPIESLNRTALADITELTTKEKDRSQNMFALGLCFWMFDRELTTTQQWIHEKFAKKPAVRDANLRSLEVGYAYGETTEVFRNRYRIAPAKLAPGSYRKITGNEATALGLVTAAEKMNKSLFYGTYPITPASDILHSLAELRHFDVRTFQAEDEIAAMGSVIGAAYGGALAVTGTSGPGLALKSEAINLAIVLELPMIIVDVQRGGPSTGLPTKTEQSDLLQALYGRNGESPIAVVAAQSPADCFEMAIWAAKLAVRSTSPVILLTDGFIANSSEPWKIPQASEIPAIPVHHPDAGILEAGEKFLPYQRDPESLARPWAIAGVPGLEYRMGGLSKAPLTGNVSYDGKDNERMNRDRIDKVARLADVIPAQDVAGDENGDLLVVSWGGTWGTVRSAVHSLRKEGKKIGHAHIRFVNPLPSNFGEILGKYKQVVVAELNGGQMAFYLQGKFGVKVHSIPHFTARPFKIHELTEAINRILQN
ncbi:MAG TPA: 2-oxoacid:acceptor oxidoreductase subunit alpha [Anaerolineales bacterium]|nr:2-oxoacid:acceptor oxidoreductase subunit alpha [Anaerolineales bacterium]